MDGKLTRDCSPFIVGYDLDSLMGVQERLAEPVQLPGNVHSVALQQQEIIQLSCDGLTPGREVVHTQDDRHVVVQLTEPGDQPLFLLHRRRRLAYY
jgi:hypothetical protein